MCGIAGILSPGLDIHARQSRVSKMCAAMVHRGPDDDGMVSAGPVTIGMRRLAIFDPRNGHQPMHTADGRFTIVFNGAIYNFRALTAELTLAGYSFETQCDTEVLLKAYAHWGRGCLGRIEGMFAFAVWDAKEEKLFVARDELGIKPLYYRHSSTDGTFVFASELNALLASGLVSSAIDPHGIAQHLGWLAVPAPKTIYRDVQALEPGCLIQLQRGTLSLERYWSLPAQNGEDRYTDEASFTAALRAKLDETIAVHSLADVPVGAFLSGGLDSAAVVALMAKHSAGKLKTFSIGFPEAAYSESHLAEETAKFVGTDHTTVELTGRQLASELPAILAGMDHPTGDGINTYYASKISRAGGVTAALSGLGGDELFGGYPSFTDLPKLASLLPFWKIAPKPVRRSLARAIGKGSIRRRKLGDFLAHSENLDELAALQRRVLSTDSVHAVLSGDRREASPFHPLLAQLRSELKGAPPTRAISGWELRTYMADVLLSDSDMMSMRQSLELRVPFVHRPFVEWLWRQPVGYLHGKEAPKQALYRSVADLLPPALMERKKRGFTFPFPVWMRSELRPFLDETFLGSSLSKSGFFSPEIVRSQWTDFLNGQDDRAWSRVWSLAVLIHFINSKTSP